MNVDSILQEIGAMKTKMNKKEKIVKTPEEAIARLKGMQNKKVDYAEMVCAPAFCSGYEYVYPEPEDYAIEEAIKALKEIQQYRKIGTVEECREAVEKQKPKKPVLRNDNGKLRKSCPVCGCFFSPLSRSCPKCGQAIL